MNSSMKIAGGLLISTGLIVLSGFIHGQETTGQTQAILGSAALPDGQNDSVVQIAAEAEELSLVTPDQIPPDRCGTWWIVTGDTFPTPYPFLPTRYDPANTPIYSLDSDGQSFLVDGTTGTNGMSAADLEAQGSMVLDFIAQVQAAQANAELHSLARSMGLEMDSEEMSSSFAIDTNGLWLDLTNVLNGLAYLNLHHGTDYVYEVWSKQNLAASNWDIETEVFPGTNQDMMPFTVSELDRTNLFLWARDWTGITSGSNETPEWWFWKYFHTVDLSDTNLDSLGNTLLYDYTNNFDPNVIQFSFQLPDHVTTNAVSGSITLWAGAPFYYAVLVNDTNVADALWQPYAGTNIMATLGATNGIYTVYVGLRGRALDEAPLWEWNTVILDATPAFLVVTNPAASIVTKPVIQLQGFASEGLSNLTFGVSNAMGVLADQPGFLAGQFYDTNLLEFTTNYFNCYDIALTNGLNIVTLHATFSRGETVTTNICVTVDYSGDVAPLIQLTWPQDGASIGGSTFTLRGILDDPTAQVSVSGLTDEPVNGKVGRDGQCWIENLPLTNGENTLTLTATDAAGNSSTTNITVVQGGVMITVNPLSDDELKQPTATVYGTVSDSSYDVWVNGVEAYYVDEGDWEADSVPVNGYGIAAFDATAYPPGEAPAMRGYFRPLDNGGGGAAVGQSLVEEMPSMVRVSSYQSQYYNNSVTVHFCDGSQSGVPDSDYYSWMPGSSDAPPSPPWPQISESDSGSEYETDAQAQYCSGSGARTYSEWTQTRTLIELVVRGQPQSGEQRLVLLTVEANKSDDGTAVLPASMTVFGQVPVPSETNEDVGKVLVDLPAGSVQNIPLTTGVSNYTRNVQPQDVNLQIIDSNSKQDLTTQTNLVIVGQQINLTCQLSVTNVLLMNSMLTNFQWTVPGYAISNYVVAPDTNSAVVITNFPLNNSNVVFYWVDGTTNRVVQCSAIINGKSITGRAVFNIYRPNVFMLNPALNGPPTNVWASSTAVWVTLGRGTIALGIESTTNNMSYDIGIVSSNFDGDAKIVQICTINATGSGLNHCTNWLDNSDPYTSSTFRKVNKNIIPTIPFGLNTMNLDDAPQAASSAFQAISMNDSFVDYVMFNPAYLGRPSIFVPIGKITWSTSAGASWPSTTISPNFVIGPTGPDGSMDFPVWTNVYSNR